MKGLIFIGLCALIPVTAVLYPDAAGLCVAYAVCLVCMLGSIAKRKAG